MSVKSPTIDRMRVDGEKLKRAREQKFMSRVELGSKVGLHPDSIGRLERGDWNGGTRIDNIRKLARALDVEPSELVNS